MRIRLNSGRVARILAMVVCGLVVAHVGLQVLAYHFDDDYLFGLEPFFDLDSEANLPTFGDSLAMLLAAAILAGIARLEAPGSDRRHWFGLAIIFLALAVDEAAAFHEIVGNLFEALFDTSDYLYYSWVVPYSVFLVVFVLFYARFLLRLPAKVRMLIIAAGSIFVLGGMGFEAMAAYRDELTDGELYLIDSIFVTTEETLEMVGISLFIYALLLHAESKFGELAISIGVSRTTPSA